ncbi:MAG: hypothetical protein NVS3B24_03440 [Candidatus Dormibacteria bacterium]
MNEDLAEVVKVLDKGHPAVVPGAAGRRYRHRHRLGHEKGRFGHGDEGPAMRVTPGGRTTGACGLVR